MGAFTFFSEGPSRAKIFILFQFLICCWKRERQLFFYRVQKKASNYLHSFASLHYFALHFHCFTISGVKSYKKLTFLKMFLRPSNYKKRRQTCREGPKWLKFLEKNSRHLLANFMLPSEHSELLLKVCRHAYTAFHSGFLNWTKTKVNLRGHSCQI